MELQNFATSFGVSPGLLLAILAFGALFVLLYHVFAAMAAENEIKLHLDAYQDLAGRYVF